MNPIRIQRKRVKGWQMPEGAVYVGRPGKWGNPFNFSKSGHCWNAIALGCRADREGRHEASVIAYRQWIDDPRGRIQETEFGVVLEGGNPTVAIPIGERARAGLAPSREEIQQTLRGKNLACWCRLDQPCHADVLLEIANGEAS
jgi:hypothetical protein